LVGLLLLYLALAVGGVVTILPWSDEAWFASPAMNLAAKGYMGTSVLDPTAAWHVRNLNGIDRFTYWMVPLYLVGQSGWQLLAGPSLFSVRFFSVLWGLGALVAWYVLLRQLTGDAWVGFLTAAFLALDFQFLWSASVARMDMMCVALGVGGLAAFVALRQTKFTLAILVSHAFVAASGLSHPAGLAYLVALVALTLYLDRRRIRFSHLAVAAAPYLASAAGWGLYIAKNPDMFLKQFGGNVGGRVATGGVLEWLKMQVVDRYLYQYGLAPDTHGLSHIKIIALAVYAVGLAGVLFTPAIRRSPGGRAVVVLWVALAVSLSLIDKEIHHFYIVHFMMPLIAILAMWVVWTWRSRAQLRGAILALVAALLFTQAAVLLSRFRADSYRREYLTAANFLKEHPAPDGVVMGSAELAFQLGFDSNLVDDYRLGYLSGKRPAVVVLDRNRYQEWIPNLEQTEPAAYSYVTNLLDREFKLAYRNPAYKIYLRSITAPGAVSR